MQPAEHTALLALPVVLLIGAFVAWAGSQGEVTVGGLPLFGLLDESTQALLPNRHYEIIDVGFNALAALMAIGASMALAWVRRWRDQTFHQ